MRLLIQDPVMGEKKVDLLKIPLLIIDSNELSRSFTRSLCRNMHFGDILIAGNSTDALDLLGTKLVGLVLCDCALKPMDAYSFVRKVRANEERWITDSKVPIIMVDSEGSPAGFMEARDAGVNDYLVRPLVMQRLMNSVSSVLASKQPYIKNKTYIGPCRRRKQTTFIGPERRAGLPPKPASLEPPKLPEKKPAATLERKEPDIIKMRLDDIVELFDLVRQMKEPDASMKEIMDRIFIKSGDVKMMGESFGFPLLTKAADLLCAFVKDVEPEAFKTLSRLQAVETHVIVMKMILDSNMHDESDELAMEVIDELQTLVNKFKGV